MAFPCPLRRDGCQSKDGRLDCLLVGTVEGGLSSLTNTFPTNQASVTAIRIVHGQPEPLSDEDARVEKEKRDLNGCDRKLPA